MIRILDGADPAERDEWVRAWQSWPGREVHAHPEYVRLFARPGDRALAAVDAGESGGLLYPFVLRPLAAEPWAPPGAPWCDTTTPYGYGGPYAWGDGGSRAGEFWAAFEAWAQRAHVVSSFARLSLFENQLAPFHGEVADVMPNVVRRLDLGADELWRDYAHKVRKNVNAARRADLVVELDAAGARIDEFQEIYRSTMERRGAAQGYYFPGAFFETIVRELTGQFLFAHVLAGGKVVSTELVLVSTEHLYSFLGGTRADAFELRPNDLLKHAVIEWGRAAGKKAYVLGGGYSGPDGIFKYKLAFAPAGEVTFRIGRKIHDPAAYDQLVADRRAFEAQRGASWAPRQGFFPAYRG